MTITNTIDLELTEAELDQVVGGWGVPGSTRAPVQHEPVHANWPSNRIGACVMTTTNTIDRTETELDDELRDEELEQVVGGTGTGKPNPQPLSWSHYYDKASPVIMWTGITKPLCKQALVRRQLDWGLILFGAAQHTLASFILEMTASDTLVLDI
jgi:hypothetical protein